MEKRLKNILVVIMIISALMIMKDTFTVYLISAFAPKSTEEIVEEIIKRGNIGRLTIPSIGVNVALFDRNITENSQEIVDAQDSAAYLYAISRWGFDLIADHTHQGFSAIKKAVIGNTYAYINDGIDTKRYVCVEIFKGYNTGTDITDMSGNSIKHRYDDNCICIYTCNEDDSITITFWKQV